MGQWRCTVPTSSTSFIPPNATWCVDTLGLRTSSCHVTLAHKKTLFFWTLQEGHMSFFIYCCPMRFTHGAIYLVHDGIQYTHHFFSIRACRTYSPQIILTPLHTTLKFCEGTHNVFPICPRVHLLSTLW